MSSDNPTGADNQQETSGQSAPLDPMWVVGFVDGEGCFSVSVHRNPLVVKGDDFRLFADIVGAMARKEHLAADGFDRIVRLAYAMNHDGKQRARTLEDVLEGSSETVRQALGAASAPRTKIQSDPHGDVRS